MTPRYLDLFAGSAGRAEKDEIISAAEFVASEAVWLDLSREMADEMRAEWECVDAWYEDFKRAVGYVREDA